MSLGVLLFEQYVVAYLAMVFASVAGAMKAYSDLTATPTSCEKSSNRYKQETVEAECLQFTGLRAWWWPFAAYQHRRASR